MDRSSRQSTNKETVTWAALQVKQA
jgi:hypothetical protein